MTHGQCLMTPSRPLPNVPATVPCWMQLLPGPHRPLLSGYCLRSIRLNKVRGPDDGGNEEQD